LDAGWTRKVGAAGETGPGSAAGGLAQGASGGARERGTNTKPPRDPAPRGLVRFSLRYI